MDLLDLNIHGPILEHHLALLPLPHPALEEVAHRVEGWHFEVVIRDHLTDETRQLGIACYLQYMPLTRLPDPCNKCLVLTLLSNLFLFLASQKAVSDDSKVKYQIFLVLFRSVISFVLIAFFELWVFRAHRKGSYMFLFPRICLQEGLEVQHLQRVPMKVNPLWNYSRSGVHTSDLLYALKKVAEQLEEAFLLHLLNWIGEGK